MIAGQRRTRSRMLIYMTILASVALVAGIAAFAEFYPAGLNTDASQTKPSSTVTAAKSTNDESPVIGRSGSSTRQADADQEGKGNGAYTPPPLPTAVNPVTAASNEPVIHEDIGLQIQAISWNQTPSRRIAVINSRLCREGEQISGYRILAINPDDIVVSNGQKTGKLLFKLN